MPAAFPNELPKTSALGGEITSAQWGEMAVSLEKLPPQDMAPLFQGVPGNRCPSYHWGFLFKGKLVVRYPDREETVEAGQAFYMEPGHVMEILEACEELAFTPSAHLREMLDVERRNAQAMPPSS